MMLHHLFQQLLDGKHHSYDGTTVMMVPQLWWYHSYDGTTVMMVP
jgi:hypothetical protein